MEKTFFDTAELQSPPLDQKSSDLGARNRESNDGDRNMADAPYSAWSITKSLKALGKLNAALATPANGLTPPYPGAYNQSGPLPSMDYSGRISGPRSEVMAVVAMIR